MSVANRRREVVKRLIAERFGGRNVDFARAIDRSPAQVWMILNRRNIGERCARHIETKLRLPIGELDRTRTPIAPLTDEEFELVRKFRQLAPDWKLLVDRILNGGPKERNVVLGEILVPRAGALATDAQPSPRRQRPKPKKAKPARKGRPPTFLF